MIRIIEIAKMHGDSAHALLAKAKTLGFQVKAPSKSLDKITAEALEIAIYGEALAVRFDKSLTKMRSSHSGAEGRLIHLRSLIVAIRNFIGDATKKDIIEVRAKQMRHLLMVSKLKDASKGQPPEWHEAELLICKLPKIGTLIENKNLPPKQPKQPVSQPQNKGSLKVRKMGKKKKKKARNKMKRTIQKKSIKMRLIYTGGFETTRRRH